ncbi:MAG: hypothetical protein IPP67_00195 [Rhodospirillaceae bacterium]|nr:hypothetical protein [Rhodospirillaceae bacterium]
MKKICLSVLLLSLSGCEALNTVGSTLGLVSSTANVVDTFTDADNQKAERFRFKGESYNILYKKQDEFQIVKVWPNFSKGYQATDLAKSNAEAVAKTYLSYSICKNKPVQVLQLTESDKFLNADGYEITKYIMAATCK